MTDSMDERFIEGLAELYDTERRLEEALGRLVEETDHEATSRAFSQHRRVTRQQAERLERVFDLVGTKPTTAEDQAVAAMLAEHEQFAADNDGEVLDRYNMGLGQRLEHYEIAAYESLVSQAERAGHHEAGELLAEAIREEKIALDAVTEASEQFDRHVVAGE